MNITDETRVALDELQQDSNDKCFRIVKAEAAANNPYGQGDIIEDHYQIGRVLNSVIKIYVDFRGYEISYRCERLTKKLTPYRGGELTAIYLTNVVRVLTNKSQPKKK